MSEKALINLTAMDFSEIKENLKAFLRNQSEFSDYNFEGSGLNVLIDLLAYNSQNNAYLANMIANESEIDSAILRSNVVSRAKLLGYTPKSNTAARAVLSVIISDPGNTTTSLLMPRGTRYVVRAGAQQFTFVTLQDYNLPLNEDGVYRNDEIEVFEGIIKSFSFDAIEDRRFVIPSKKLDTSTLKVVVFDSYAYNANEIYEQAFGVSKIGPTSAVFWIYETDNGNYEIKFGDNVFGKTPILNSIVYTEYLETNGSSANDFSQFSLVGVFEGYENADVTIESINSSSGGSEPELTSSIKLNATRFFQSQNRAITKEDFAAITNDIYPYAKSVAVWGGEEVSPPKYGQVFISIIPNSITKLTSTNKRDLERKIRDRSVVGIQPKIVDPKFIKINLSTFVDVRRNSSSGLNNFSKEIRDLIVSYFDNGFGIFNNDFYYSNLLTIIKNYSRSIVGVRAEYTISLTASLLDTDYYFENAIVKGSLKSNKVRVAGDSVFYTIEDTNSDGILYAGLTAIGTVNYDTGSIYVNTSIIQETSTGALELFVEPLEDDIFAGFATAIALDTTRLAVELRSV
jgi:hypothetical protein